MFSISSVADEAPQLYHLTSDTASCLELSIFSHDRHYLNILVLVAEVLRDELDRLRGLVGLWRQKDVGHVAVPPVRDGRVILEGLAGVELAGGVVQVRELHHLEHTRLSRA